MYNTVISLQEFRLGQPRWYKMRPRDYTNLEHKHAIGSRHRQAPVQARSQRNTVDEKGSGELPEHNSIVRVQERRTHVRAHHKAREIANARATGRP